jgi:hypothetical protein
MKTKSYNLNSTPQYKLHGNQESRATMFRQRLILGQQRLLRGGLVRLRVMDSNKLREDDKVLLESNIYLIICNIYISI